MMVYCYGFELLLDLEILLILWHDLIAKYWHLGKYSYVSTHLLTLSEQNQTLFTVNASKDLTLLQRSNLTFNRVGGCVNQPLAVPIIAAHSRRVRDCPASLPISWYDLLEATMAALSPTHRILSNYLLNK